MKIGFLVGSSEISGGTNVILEYASRLQDKGHQVTLIVREQVNSAEVLWHPAAHKLKWIKLPAAESLSFDYVVATWWQSVFYLQSLRARAYVYFVQSIESRFFPEENDDCLDTRDITVIRGWCESTYAFPLPVITEAAWIKEYLVEHYNNRQVQLVRNGIRKDIYHENEPAVSPRQESVLRVLVEGPLGVFFKNVEKTIELCKRSDADEIWLLTSSEITDYPGVDRCFSCVSVEKTAEIYRSCDVLVKLSYVEGMFGPPLEMFHCGGTAIVYDVTGHDEYIKHEQNALVVERNDELQVVAFINKLKNQPDQLHELKRGALETADNWPDWSISVDSFEEALTSIPQQFLSVPPFLKEYTDQALKIRDTSFAERAFRRLADRESIAPKRKSEFHNFIQVYWHDGGGFSNEQMKWAKYDCGLWNTSSVNIPLSVKKDLHLRVDPSVRVGIVMIKRIRLYDQATEVELGNWQGKEIISDLFITGTARITVRDHLTLECYGEDPQIIFPVLRADQNIKTLVLEIELKEIGFAESLSLEDYRTADKVKRENIFTSLLSKFKMKLGG
jgi:glycosyltransferase involved in cell wall biosynthesis